MMLSQPSCDTRVDLRMTRTGVGSAGYGGGEHEVRVLQQNGFGERAV